MPDLKHSDRILMVESYPEHCPIQHAAVWRENDWTPASRSTHHVRMFDDRDECVRFLSEYSPEGKYTFCELIVDVCHGHCTMMLVPTHVIRGMSVGAAGDIAYGDGDVLRLILDHLRDCSADRPSESVLSE